MRDDPTHLSSTDYALRLTELTDSELKAEARMTRRVLDNPGLSDNLKTIFLDRRRLEFAEHFKRETDPARRPTDE